MLARAFAWIAAMTRQTYAAIRTLTRWTPRLLGFSGSTAQDELRNTVDVLHREGSVVKSERDMLGGLLDLKELEVSDVMVHRTEMVSINVDDPVEKIVKEVLESRYSRIPLWKDSADNITGILHGKDLLLALHAAGNDVSRIDIPKLAKAPWFVPQTRPVEDQLRAFLRRKTHFALVVDEYGEMMGAVTLEDVMEEIVGDISDEHDAVDDLRRHPDGSVTLDGAVPIRDLNRSLDWKLPDAEATTVAGLVIHEAKMIPELGQTFTFHGYRFQVLGKIRNRITSLRVMPLRKEAQRGKAA